MLGAVFTVIRMRPYSTRPSVVLRAICQREQMQRAWGPDTPWGAMGPDLQRGKGGSMRSFEGMDQDDPSFKALSLILEAWDEGTESGVPTEQMAYAALFTAFTDLVAQFGEDAVLTLARGLERRILLGEFSLNRTRQ
jgi:hypothetical protein